MWNPSVGPWDNSNVNNQAASRGNQQWRIFSIGMACAKFDADLYLGSSEIMWNTVVGPCDNSTIKNQAASRENPQWCLFSIGMACTKFGAG
jgi:hypothetical protein